MKVVILAGGRGTRLAEETQTLPKPMVEIGDRPILWHILKIYSHFGFNEFVVAVGYKGDYIKRYFLDYARTASDFTVDLATGKVDRHGFRLEDWKIHIVDTGLGTQTGGRVHRLRHLLADGPFLLTYGDGVSNVDVAALLRFHQSSGCAATITAVRPPARFGEIMFDDKRVVEFAEKAQASAGWINGGFAVLEPETLSYLKDDDSVLELDLFEQLAKERNLAAYRHDGFWQCMDTLRDKRLLESLWVSGSPPWKLWRDAR
jgi:glucose-1-phosphate cytidylyltransferase